MGHSESCWHTGTAAEGCRDSGCPGALSWPLSSRRRVREQQAARVMAPRTGMHAGVALALVMSMAALRGCAAVTLEMCYDMAESGAHVPVRPASSMAMFYSLDNAVPVGPFIFQRDRCFEILLAPLHATGSASLARQGGGGGTALVRARVPCYPQRGPDPQMDPRFVLFYQTRPQVNCAAPSSADDTRAMDSCFLLCGFCAVLPLRSGASPPDLRTAWYVGGVRLHSASVCQAHPSLPGPPRRQGHLAGRGGTRVTARRQTRTCGWQASRRPHDSCTARPRPPRRARKRTPLAAV